MIAIVFFEEMFSVIFDSGSNSKASKTYEYSNNLIFKLVPELGSFISNTSSNREESHNVTLAHMLMRQV